LKKEYRGSCHCGNVEFTVNADIEGDRNALCNCSRCGRLGFLHHHVDKSDFRLVRGAGLIQTYRFGTLAAEHMFCRICGVQAFYRSRSDPDRMDVNLRCLEGVDVHALKYWLVDGQNWEQAQAARRRAQSAAKPPPRYSILTECTDTCSPAGQRAFFDSWH
jgi:hypothetical protein